MLFLTSMYYMKKVCTLFGARDSSLLLNSCCLGIAALSYSIALSINVASLATGYPDINELSEKKSIYIALEQGFDQAYRTIIDSNLTTLIVAFFLYIFGNGAVKGFAVTLGIGITASMFSSISLSRMLIALWLKKTRPKKLNLW